MIPTVSYIKEKFITFNNLYFNSELPLPVIKLSKCKRSFGDYNPQKDCLRLSIVFNRPEHDIETTIIHEMIHQYQVIKYNCCDHGRTFKHEARRIYNIDGKYKITATSVCSVVYNNDMLPIGKYVDLLVWKSVHDVCFAKINPKYLVDLNFTIAYNTGRTPIHVKVLDYVYTFSLSTCRQNVRYKTVNKDIFMDKIIPLVKDSDELINELNN